MERKSEVFVTKEDKDSLVEHMNIIKAITDKYPYSNDYSDSFMTTMKWVKSFVHDLHKWIGYLEIK